MIKKVLLACCIFIGASTAWTQTQPVITNWLQNTTQVGSYYMQGNSTPISNNIVVNVQSVKYSATSVYISTNGVPAYPTGPFLDGNPSQAQAQNAIFKLTLSPTQNTGTPASTSLGTIGLFINGVSLFDYRDGVSWKNSTNAMAGGPLGGQGDGVWNRDAIVFERDGFDCSKGHPAMGQYHHHQNPSAFKLDLNVVSSICNLYDADGLYVIDPSVHSPLIGFAADGFPIYGAYGYKNSDGTGGITRIKSGYQLRNITTRTTYYTGTTVTAGPAVSTTYPLGTFREDYEFVTHTDEDYLDIHNGRFCVTPEYPNGTYAYFCTVDENHNSAYPYAVGPTYYGVVSLTKVNSISESTTTYVPNSSSIAENGSLSSTAVTIFPNPASDLIAIQLNGLNKNNITIELIDMQGKVVDQATIHKGATIAYFDTQKMYPGNYVVRLSDGNVLHSRTIVIEK